MQDKHLSSQFDHELSRVSSRVLEMGGMVEMQIRQAMHALGELSVEVADQVEETERRVNALELDIDRELTTIIARRQPTAIDLRLLLTLSKTTANLERAGDEAAKIARVARRIVGASHARVPPSAELSACGDLAARQLRKALDAFARLSVEDAVTVIRDDGRIDQAFEGVVRQLITYMMEDPRTISASLELMMLAKAIERIGDHAKNIAEFIIYIVNGDDVRHSGLERAETIVRS
jgi:phosphate transport system protein